MRDAEWRLVYADTDLTFGTAATPVFNRTTPDVGDVDLRAADTDRPRADGRAFGVDYRGPRTITFDLGLRAPTEAEVRAVAEDLSRAWRADAVRSVPGAVAALHAQYAGRERVVFGRPRRFAPDFSETRTSNFVGVVADFACIDDLFYGATDEAIECGTTTPGGGGLVAPLASPLSTTLTSDRSTAMNVATEVPVWPVVEMHGPITNPVVSIGTDVRFEVRLTLAYDETVVIDTRPWARTVLRNGASVAGALRGTRLSRSALPAGRHEVGFRGVDATGTASVRVSWRAAYSSL